jgi:hypothetical protein
MITFSLSSNQVIHFSHINNEETPSIGQNTNNINGSIS